jgi:hypothetical protein
MNKDFYKSHKLFFSLTTHEKLNEFLKRADSSTRVLENHINQELKDGLYCKVKLNSEKPEYNQGIKTNSCTQIVIEYYNSNNTRIGHTTFHLEPEKKNNQGNPIRFGRIHLRNNINKKLRYVLKLDETNSTNYNKSIKFSISNSEINKELEKCIDTTIFILNKYFDLNNNELLSIDNKLAENYSYISNKRQIQSYWHKCFGIIKTSFNKSRKNTLRKTTFRKKRINKTNKNKSSFK